MIDEFSTLVWFIQRSNDLIEGNWVNAALAAALLLACKVTAWTGWRGLRLIWWAISGISTFAYRCVIPRPVPPPPLGDVALVLIHALEHDRADYDDANDRLAVGKLAVWPRKRTMAVADHNPLHDMHEHERELVWRAVESALTRVKDRQRMERQLRAMDALTLASSSSAKERKA
jgi:hypothetical protein